MDLVLDAEECRVIGCLVEKEITTPDHYPLSLNALVAACNQTTNRDPVVEWDEPQVQRILDRLSAKHLVLERSGFGSRVVKYRHRLCNGDHNPRQFSATELAVVCELMLRGPQTPGELRSRAQRLAPFATLAEVESTLERLAARSDGPFVAALARAPGAREVRFRHLFTASGDGDAPDAPAAVPAALPARHQDLAARVDALEAEVAELRAELARLARVANPQGGESAL